MKLYTLEEARAVLPNVIELLRRLTRGARHDAPVPSAAAQNGHAHGGGMAARDAELALEELNEMGIVVRDMDRGLIDFISEREGRVVCLCFLLGEDDIAYWHEESAGFAGRQPL